MTISQNWCRLSPRCQLQHSPGYLLPTTVPASYLTRSLGIWQKVSGAILHNHKASEKPRQICSMPRRLQRHQPYTIGKLARGLHSVQLIWAAAGSAMMALWIYFLGRLPALKTKPEAPRLLPYRTPHQKALQHSLAPASLNCLCNHLPRRRNSLARFVTPPRISGVRSMIY
jgi:hypothetical protein